MQNLKKDTYEILYKAKVDSQTQKTNLQLLKGKGKQRDELGLIYIYIYITTCKIDNQQAPTILYR